MNALKDLISSSKQKKTVKSDRPVVEVPQEALQAFERLSGATAIAEVAEARQEIESELVKEIMLDSFAETLFKFGFVPANPRLTVDKHGVPDLSAIFQVQTRYKIDMPEEVNGDSDVAIRLQTALENAGLDKANAESLVANEIDAQPKVTLRPFNELVNGHYEGEGKNKAFVEATALEQAVGQKLLSFVMGNSAEPLSETERNIAIRMEENCKVKEGFLQRVKQYCKTLEQVQGLLKVIKPTHFVSHMKYGISDTPEARQSRLVDEFAKLIGNDQATTLKVAA